MSLSEEQIKRFARQILVIGGVGQEKLGAQSAQADPDSLVGRYLSAGGTPLSPKGMPLCSACVEEFGDDARVALSFQQRVLTGTCPRHPLR